MESLVLSCAGGAVAFLLVVWSADALLAMTPPGTPRLARLAPDAGLLFYSAGLALLTGAVFGIAPAVRRSRIDPALAWNERRGESPPAGGLRAGLVVSEIALALVLFVGALLMLRSFERLRRYDPGFATRGVLTFRVGLSDSRYPDNARRLAFFDELFRRLEALPGVGAAGGTTRFPLDPGYGVGSVNLEGRPLPPGERPVVGVRSVSAGYFRAMRIPLLQGRQFDGRDGERGPRAVLINRAMARSWPAGRAVGRRLLIGSEKTAWRTVVGVVGDVSHDRLDSAAVPEIYLPLAQSPESGLNVVVRTSRDPKALASAARKEIAAIDSLVPLIELRTMEDRVAQSTGEARFLLETFGAFALLAILLARIGLAGLVAYGVAQRRREIAVRMSVGAAPADVLRLFFSEGVRWTAAGIVTGGAASWALARLVGSLLHGVPPRDAASFAGASLLLTAVAAVAIYLPARRATRVDPMTALRQE